MVWLQALHAMCRTHFEEDQAAGGNLYAKFARCYLQLSGAQPDQHKTKAQPQQAQGPLLSDQVSRILTFHSDVCFGASGWLPVVCVLPLNASVQRAPIAMIATAFLIQAVMLKVLRFSKTQHACSRAGCTWMRLCRSGQMTAKLCCF